MPSRGVLLGFQNTLSGNGAPMLTSTDAENWTLHGYFPQEPFKPPTVINALAFGNGNFVAGGNGSLIYFSSNGSDWQESCLHCVAPSTIGFDPVRSIAHGNGRFIAVGDGNVLYVASESNLRQWSVLRSENDLNAVAYGNGRFVTVGSNSTVWVSSDNGKNWSWAFGGKADGWVPHVYGVAFGNNTFAAVGGPGPHLATSADGLLWDAQRNSLPTGETLLGVAFGNGLFVAVGYRDEPKASNLGNLGYAPRVILTGRPKASSLPLA